MFVCLFFVFCFLVLQWLLVVLQGFLGGFIPGFIVMFVFWLWVKSDQTAGARLGKSFGGLSSLNLLGASETSSLLSDGTEELSGCGSKKGDKKDRPRPEACLVPWGWYYFKHPHFGSIKSQNVAALFVAIS